MKCLNKLSIKNKEEITEENMNILKVEAYLKIANIYFLLKDYDNTLKTLDLVPDIKLKDSSVKEKNDIKSDNSQNNLNVS